LIFLGDIALPFGVDPSPATRAYERVFDGEPAAANLEGGILETQQATASLAGLYNSPQVRDLLSGLNVKIVSLANNHILDTGRPPSRTAAWLGEHGIASCGAGDDAAAARAPVHLELEGTRLCFLAFGWQPIGCRPATDRTAGVAPLRTESVLAAVEACRKSWPDDKIVLMMHWNYELELYPQPAHRRLARAAIDCGAAAIIGHHSHRVQGIEFYHEAPIVYGLGNGFFPQGVFFDGKLVYPKVCASQLAFAWDPVSGASRCHWFIYQRKDHTVQHDRSEDTRTSGSVAALTPYAGFTDAEYLRWFKINRTRRFLLPVYDDDTQVIRNRLRDGWLNLRNWISRHRPRQG
jgi:poly-gamma-glutamate synthesis protein (capsule biosynthesis protein)